MTEDSGWTRRVTFSSRVVLAALMVAGGGVASSLGAAEPPDLSGPWQLDEELSDDPMDAIRRARENSSGRSAGGLGGGPGRRGGGAGGGLPGGGGARRGDTAGRGGRGGPSEETRSRMATLRESVAYIEIDQAAGSIAITYADDHVVAMETDGKKREMAGRLGPAEVRAKWKKSTLEIRQESEGRKTTEIYRITDDRKLLRVTVRQEMDAPVGTIEYTRLYRPADPRAPSAEAPAEPLDP